MPGFSQSAEDSQTHLTVWIRKGCSALDPCVWFALPRGLESASINLLTGTSQGRQRVLQPSCFCASRPSCLGPKDIYVSTTLFAARGPVGIEADREKDQSPPCFSFPVLYWVCVCVCASVNASARAPVCECVCVFECVSVCACAAALPLPDSWVQKRGFHGAIAADPPPSATCGQRRQWQEPPLGLPRMRVLSYGKGQRSDERDPRTTVKATWKHLAGIVPAGRKSSYARLSSRGTRVPVTILPGVGKICSS
nr:uncharacterized protein LOC132417907 [Delphinus delphis]